MKSLVASLPAVRRRDRLARVAGALLLAVVACTPSPPAALPGSGPVAASEVPSEGAAESSDGGSPTTSLPSHPGAELREVSGHVQKVGDFGWGLVPDADPGTRYAPDHLAADFEQDGLAVVFSGVLGEIPPGARLWGTPLRLTAIRRLAD